MGVLLLACDGRVDEQSPGGNATSSGGGSGSTTSSSGGSTTSSSGGSTSTIGPTLPATLVVGNGLSNRTYLGGYWYTFLDRSGKSSVLPDTGKIDPLDTTTMPAKLKPGLGPGNGIENGMYHVTGAVGVAPLYNTTTYDTYWDAFYGPNGSVARGVCASAGCREIAYPEAGLAVDFKTKAFPLGSDAAGKVGISFRLKLGPNHAAGMPINVSIPLDLTDAPDPTFGEEFGTLYAGMMTAVVSLSGTNTPICTFPGSVKLDGTQVGSTAKTCFAHLTTAGHTVLDATTTETKTFCLGWQAFGPPSWAGPALMAAEPVPISDLAPLINRAIRIRFEAYRPGSNEPEAVPFDFYVDDVYLLDEAKWNELCTGSSVVLPPAQ